jgi:hypothetical protein
VPTVTGSASSSNPTCPLTGKVLSAGDLLYTMTEYDSDHTFVLTMNAETNAQIGTHGYTVTATATGDGTGSVEGSYEL